MPRRPTDALRPISITPGFLVHPEGSALIAWGDTRVICTASVEERVPNWLTGKGRGWVTAEYDMLPRATNTRSQRASIRGKPSGRAQEISRLIGRSLRAVVDTGALGERTISIDCDVIQADGGTRTASITGGYIALALAVGHLKESGKVKREVLLDHVAAVSVGIVEGVPHLDLDYALDSAADVDMNLVMTGKGDLIEIQGTGEKTTFSRPELDQMLDLALGARPTLVDLQTRAIAAPFAGSPEPITT